VLGQESRVREVEKNVKGITSETKDLRFLDQKVLPEAVVQTLHFLETRERTGSHSRR